MLEIAYQIAQLVLTLATIALAILAWLYWRETKRLRVTGEKQLEEQQKQHEINIEELHRQVRLSVAPIVSLQQITTKKQFLESNDGTYTEDQVSSISKWDKWLTAHDLQYNFILQIQNPGNQPAVNVTTFISRSGQFCFSPNAIQVLSPSQSDFYPIATKMFSPMVFREIFAKYYGDEAQKSLFNEGERLRDFIAICYCDPEDHVYIQKASIASDDPIKGLLFYGTRAYLGRRKADCQPEEALKMLITAESN